MTNLSQSIMGFLLLDQDAKCILCKRHKRKIHFPLSLGEQEEEEAYEEYNEERRKRNEWVKGLASKPYNIMLLKGCQLKS